MPVCKVIKDRNFTTISNYHLRDKSLSMKAKGLLTIMLSLPEEWDYTINGLATLSADGRDSISNTIRELEEHGYVKRHQSRAEKGTFAQNEYWIYEMPQTDTEENKYEFRNGSVNAPISDDIEDSCKEDSSSAEYEFEDVYEADEDVTENSTADDEYCAAENRPFSYRPMTDYPMTAKSAQLNTEESILNNQRFDTI